MYKKYCSCGYVSYDCYLCVPDPDCPEAVCTAIGGTYNADGCSKHCATRKTNECGCKAGGGTFIDGYCTAKCNYGMICGGGN